MPHNTRAAHLGRVHILNRNVDVSARDRRLDSLDVQRRGREHNVCVERAAA